MNQDKRPNVVVIVVHDLGDYLGSYGHRVVSPNLDRLAAEGVRFTSHFCTSPFCSTSEGLPEAQSVDACGDDSGSRVEISNRQPFASP